MLHMHTYIHTRLFQTPARNIYMHTHTQTHTHTHPPTYIQMPARKVLRTLKDDEEQDKIKKVLGERLGKLSNTGESAMSREDLLPPLSRSSKRLNTSDSARSHFNKAGDDAGGAEGDENRPRSRLGTSSTRSSRRSRSVLSMSSTVTRNTVELMDRIKGLEEALKTEQKLRHKMQTLIALETWAE